MLAAEHITVRYGTRTVVSDLSFHLRPGQWLMLAGPNGAGKTTLIEAITQGVPYSGSFRWYGRDLKSVSPGDIARGIGVLSQRNSLSYAYSVEEIVSLGRYAHQRGFLSLRDEEGQARVEEALAAAGLTDLRRASMLTLSGGETQRVFLAQVLAQDPRLLILDEPANHLDLKYQQSIFTLIGEWLRRPDRAVLSVVHDLSLALRFGTDALLMKDGRCVSQGPIREVLTRSNLREAYDMDVSGWMLESLARWQET